MDPRIAQLVRALTAQRQGGATQGANLGGVGGHALPFAQGVMSPRGLGGYWSTPISFNPSIAGGVGASFAGNANLGAGTAAAGAADSSGAGIGGVLPSDAAPTPGGGATQSGTATTQGSGWYQSDPGSPAPASSFIPPAPSLAAPVLASNPGTAPAPTQTQAPTAHYGGMNLGDPTDPFNYRYLYQRQFGG